MKGRIMAGKKLDIVVGMFRVYLHDQGWSIVREKELQNGLQLQALGVRDSKQLSDAKILSLAEEIKKICHGHGHIVAYRPERYNQLYQETPNLNQLLATAHAQVIASLQKRTASHLALVDQFSSEPLVLAALCKMNCQITVEQRPRAEDDIAVAAASIIARATFVRQMEELSQSIGVELPKGASSPMIVTVGREIVAREGRDALGKVAKLHFKTTQEILQ
jgi:ribonuclease HIII